MKTFKQLKEELDSLYFSEEEILAILSDESIDEEVRKEIFDHFFQEADVDWDAVGKGVAQGVSFGYAPQIKAKAKSLWKGSDYEKELEKEKSEYEKAQERSPKSFAAGEYGSMLIPAGGAVLGAAKAAKMAKGAVLGTQVKYQAKKLTKAINKSKDAEEALKTVKKGKDAVDIAKAKVNVAKAAKEETSRLNKLVGLDQKLRSMKQPKRLDGAKISQRPKLPVKTALVGTAVGMGIANKDKLPSIDDVKTGASDAYDKAKDAVGGAADKAKDAAKDAVDKAKEKLGIPPTGTTPTKPIPGQDEKKVSEPDGLEKRIKQLNVQRADIAKKGIGVGDPTKTASERGMTGDAAQKYNQFVAARDEKLKQDLEKIATRK